MALATDHGVEITNRAFAQYEDETGFREQVMSSQVRIQVALEERLLLEPDHTEEHVPGATVSFAHRLENRGNGLSDIRLEVHNLQADDYDLERLTLYHDVNGNGLADAGEAVIFSEGPPLGPQNHNPLTLVSLAAGQSMRFVILGRVPDGATKDEAAVVRMSATAMVQGVTAQVTDTVTVLGSLARIEIVKSASTTTAQRNDEVEFNLMGSNVGSGVLGAIAVNVDGFERMMCVVRDVIPSNTEFVSFERDFGGERLYHRHGDPLHFYRTTPPADLVEVGAIGVGFPTLADKSAFEISFKVKISSIASGDIVNTGMIYFHDGVSSRVEDSNPVVVEVPLVEPTIEYYRSSDFLVPTPVSRLGNPLYVGAEASACNEFPTVVERRVITLVSSLTGDAESFEAVETGPNTGRFLVLPFIATQDANTHTVVTGDGIMQTKKNDSLAAEISGCGSSTVVTTILIDPFGIVFSSKDDTPVAGAVVSLIDVTGAGNGGNPGGPATVLLADAVTPAPSTVTTGVDGLYEFPLVSASVYRLEVTPPPAFKYPSAFAPAQLPAGRTVVASASYGGDFPVDLSTGPVRVDVPVDPDAILGALLVDKKASREVAELGDSVIYNIEIKNTAAFIMSGVTLEDNLPAGFRYQPGTARYNGLSLADPVGGEGPRLLFALGAIGPSTTVELSYQVRLGPGALEGDGVNRAQATSAAPPSTSNLATAQVKVEPGVFTDKGVIVGRIFMDENGNRIQDEGEMGVPGVRIYMENGNYVITDRNGLYNLYGITARTHVLKVDPITLPYGARLSVLSTKNAGDGATRFVELTNGELHKANFAIEADAGGREEVLRRRLKFEGASNELEVGLQRQLRADGRPLDIGDVKARPNTGMIGQNQTQGSLIDEAAFRSLEQRVDGDESRPMGSGTNAPISRPNFKPLLPRDSLNGSNSNLPARPVDASFTGDLEADLPKVENNALAFMDLRDGDVLPTRQSNVRVKGPMNSRLTLELNGVEIPSERIGKRARLASKQVDANEYIGVNFEVGENTLSLKQYDPFGNQRGEQTVRVTAPGDLATIRLRLPAQDVYAETDVNAAIEITIVDAQGLPVTVQTPVTLEASVGRWEVKDENEKEPGTQIFVRGGKAVVELVPPTDPGTALIRVSAGVIKAEEELAFLPNLRPFMAVGVIEGSINLRDLASGSIRPARSSDGFSEELRDFSVTGNDGRVQGAGRAAFFLKGKVLGKYLLTASYDSEKDEREKLFRDIEPDEYYPIYGDSSTRGFDAQSTGKLFVRIDHRKSFLLYGDYTTQGTERDEARSLGNYNRSLNGVNYHYERERVKVNAWASQDTTRQMVAELPANGTSGPYNFGTANGLVNSERIEILTRDRNQPAVVLKVEQMARFVDYEFEPFTGRVVFRQPIPSLDANLNPISIRATFELDQGGTKFWVYGADGKVKVHERVELGGGVVRDENPLDNFQLYSANATIKLAEKTHLIGEVARSESDLMGSGNGGRAELRHSDDKTDARIFYTRTGNTFTNSSSFELPGRVEAGVEASRKIGPGLRLNLEGIVTEDFRLNGSRKGVRAGVEKSLKGNYVIQVDGRVSQETGGPASTNTVGVAPNKVRSVRLRAGGPVPSIRNLDAYAEVENDVVNTDNRLVAVGADYKADGKGRVYARHEFMNALGGPFELNGSQSQNRTVFGFEQEYMKGGQMFNEYRARDTFAGREAEAAMGLRNLWTLSDGLRARTTFERVNPMTAGLTSESTAVSLGIEYTRNPDWRGTARIELRRSNGTDNLLNTFGYARRINQNWTFLGKTILNVTSNKGGKDTLQARIQSGLAWRQLDSDEWNALMKHEFKIEDGNPFGGALNERRHVNVLSADVNYQPTADWLISGHYAGKLVMEQAPFEDVYQAHLLGSRISYELTDKWDIGLTGSILFAQDFESVKFGLGPEIGYTVRQNLRIGLGYNFFGFEDRDLRGQDYTSHGLYMALRLKFDEGLFEPLRDGKDKE